MRFHIDRRILLLALVLVSACTEKNHPSSPGAPIDDFAAADLVFRNGAIYTVDANRSWANAVAIRDGKIVYVGRNDGVGEFEGRSTRIVDLAGRMLMPAFQDSHIHPIMSGIQALSVDLSDAGTLDQYIEAVDNYAGAHPDVPWILGGGWSMAVFGPGALTERRLLDKVVSDRPVYLVSRDGHSAWVNSRALEMAGIDRNTPDPASGRIDRDPDTGEAVGSLQEGAMNIVESVIPDADRDARAAGLRYSIDLLNSYGITAVQDAWVTSDDLKTYRALDDQGGLSLRVVASLWWDRSKGLEQIANFRRQREEFTKGNLSASTVKIMQDGVMENYTAAMLEPYLGKGDTAGIPMIDPDLLKKAVTELDAAGFQVHFHAIGDAAIRQCLDAVQAAISKNGDLHNRHHISHLQLIDPDDIPRFRELGVIANFQPLWAYADDYVTELTLPYIGEKRGRRLYPIRSVVNSGGMIAFGSDWSVSTANPLPQIETAVTRTDAFGDDDPFLPEQTIDLATAIAAFTINAAYVNHIEDISGSIEVGKSADLIVLDRNLFAIPAKELSDAEVVLTLLKGSTVHGDLTAL